MKKYKVKWTVIESSTYEVEAETFEQAVETVQNNYKMPDDIENQTFTDADKPNGIKFNDFVSTALSNDIICIVDDIERGQIIESAPAYKLIDGKYADRTIDRFSLMPRSYYDGHKNGSVMIVTLRED